MSETHSETWVRDAKMSLCPGVSLVRSNEEVLFFDEAAEQVYGIDGPAAEALSALEEGKTYEQARDWLSANYEVDASRVDSDLRLILNELTSRSLIRRAGV